MKSILSIFIALLFSASLFAGKGLIVSQKYSSVADKANVNVTWYVTETQCKMKMDFSNSDLNTSTWFLPDLGTGKLLSYGEGPIPAGVQKTYYAIPVEKVNGGTNVARVTVTHTGETKTLSGMLCEKITVKTNKSITEMWVTKDFKTDLYKYYGFFQSSYELMGLSEESISGFPLESVTKDNAGNVISSMQLQSATPSELSTADFTVPADYKLAGEGKK